MVRTSDTRALPLLRDGGSEPKRTALAGRMGCAARETVRSYGLGIWCADTVRFTLHGVDEVAILTHERIALRLPNGPTLAHIDHQLELRHLHCHAITEHVQTDAVRPSQEAR